MIDQLSQIDTITDPSLLDKYSNDASGYKHMKPSIVYRPRNTEEVATVVKYCHEQNKSFTVQGGLSGLAAGAIPNEGDIAINLELMNKIEEIDTVGGTALVQAGVVLETLQQAVLEQGWYFPLDLGARGSCHVGGNIATNAGGNKVFRYGTMRDLTLGVEVVLPDGTVLDMTYRMIKNNTGLDLKHLFIGSEGRYGIVTRAVLRLYPKPAHIHNALVALDDFEAVTALLTKTRASLAEIASFEVMWREYLVMSSEVQGLSVPFGGEYPYYVLMEVEGSRADLNERFHDYLGGVLEEGLAVDALIPQNHAQSDELWQIRDGIMPCIRKLGTVINFDIGLPIKHMKEFYEKFVEVTSEKYPNMVYLIFGHIGDGNLHITTGGITESDIIPVEKMVYEIIKPMRGSITAEHGIGRIKKDFLTYTRDPEQIEVMKMIKNTINSKDLLNRGRVID
ncbi:FAD-binding oxidoreductase [Taylorella equigenitalis]|uniref:D-2-hydroxyglutarate dehydrogenase n=2 Tax=Taylorella equigenitalis TaxID=29575 RepID=A0A654KGD3_TAYEM|nr:FAD-binding oxidoreductase [Taylorella equigenitalis]ADU91497.1 D-2-hydroxyglutarate dehydrogenase [Taylorella equigenitalis MCE9]ASY31146.1 FAD-binding oxidoreductase [Taylorella equigenitalis]ASY38446.1 FAD-binding oxidoreductase [Taylorella equigenitalis]ASY41425.1 FAD-binding oxidoreductase [Taylorella equigenitalis]KGK33838.1 FAD-linked oxidase [Taylorella equigenitalis]